MRLSVGNREPVTLIIEMWRAVGQNRSWHNWGKSSSASILRVKINVSRWMQVALKTIKNFFLWALLKNPVACSVLDVKIIRINDQLTSKKQSVFACFQIFPTERIFYIRPRKITSRRARTLKMVGRHGGVLSFLFIGSMSFEPPSVFGKK